MMGRKMSLRGESWGGKLGDQICGDAAKNFPQTRAFAPMKNGVHGAGYTRGGGLNSPPTFTFTSLLFLTSDFALWVRVFV